MLTGSSELARRLARPGSAHPEPGLIVRIALPEAFGAEPLLRLTAAPAPPAVPGTSTTSLDLGAPGHHGPAPGAGLGLLALTVAVEIAATGTQHRVLGELTAAAADLAPSCTVRPDSRLRAAEEAVRDAQTALLEHGTVGTGGGLGTAVANLSVLRHQTHAWITGWERVLAGADRAGTPGTALREQLGEVGRVGWSGWVGAVHGAYQALVLDGRRLLLSAADHLLRSPNRPLPALRPLVEADLAARAADAVRLHRLLTGLSTLPLTVRRRPGAMMPNLLVAQAAANGRTQVLFSRMAHALHPPGWSGGVAVELRSGEAGELQLLGPV